MKEVIYFLMRHSDYYNSENQFISYFGMRGLKSSMEKLEEELNIKNYSRSLKIVHSEFPRAKHTALLIQEMLSSIKIELCSDSRLNCNQYKIRKKFIEEVVSDCEEEGKICLLLSHQPDIENFCKKDLCTSQYITMKVMLEEKVIEEDDDLPF